MVPLKMVCVGCGNKFETRDKRKKLCKKDCSKKAKIIPKNFIGIDGEGVTLPSGDHRYVLLSVGDKSLTSNDNKQLDFIEICEFLWDCFIENQNATYVGFFLGYDYTQWFKTLPEDRAKMLLSKQGIASRQRKKSGGNPTPFPVFYKEWAFDIHANKRFKLQKIGAKTGWMYINDTGAFFQTSFLNAIDPKTWTTPIATDEEFETIVIGKSKRQDAQLNEEMIKYNITENLVLGKLINNLNDGFIKADIKLKRNQWYGPGQAAGKWLDNIGVPTKNDIIDIMRVTDNENILNFGRESYYGGWFEIFAHGHIPGKSYEYDINSAYPFIISELPCLLHGNWIVQNNLTTIKDNTYRLIHCTISGNDPIVGTLSHRNSKGNIARPHTTMGWYWFDELSYAVEAGLVDSKSIQYDMIIDYEACDCPPPFESIVDLYDHRLKVGKNSPSGKAYKLVYNSSYGKLAQSIGDPKFSNSIYASMITSGCRTQILDAIATHPTKTKDLLMIATDGIYFRTPHPNLEFSKTKLGMWDSEVKENLTLFMPGIYWDDSTREIVRKGTAPKLKSRGINGVELARWIDNLDDQFLNLDVDKWPKATIPISFNMVSAVQALARNKWDTCGKITNDEIREIDSNPWTKRSPESLYKDNDIYRTKPYDIIENGISVPYDKHFGNDDNDGYLTPDGYGDDVFYRAIS